MLNLYTATQSLVNLYKCSVKKKYISGHTGPAIKLINTYSIVNPVCQYIRSVFTSNADDPNKLKQL
jgi:hypothetical protein